MPKIDPELRRKVLTYLAKMKATEAERADVWYWVRNGIDIYDNPWFYCDETGRPADLVTAMRMDKDCIEVAISEEERLDLTRDHSEESLEFEQSLWILNTVPGLADLILDGHLT